VGENRCNETRRNHGHRAKFGLMDRVDSLARPKAPPMVRKKLRPEVTTARSGAALVLSAATRAGDVSLRSTLGRSPQQMVSGECMWWRT
jgi:hypothetical protein